MQIKTGDPVKFLGYGYGISREASATRDATVTAITRAGNVKVTFTHPYEGKVKTITTKPFMVTARAI